MQENAELMIADPPQFADLKFALKIASKKPPFYRSLKVVCIPGMLR
jgi:hypothetical protein